jgi:hypothetical protein
MPSKMSGAYTLHDGDVKADVLYFGLWCSKIHTIFFNFIDALKEQNKITRANMNKMFSRIFWLMNE